MDNVTHTLAGAAVAELVVRVRAMRHPDERVPALRGALWLTSVLASNAPDADILLAPAIRSPLGYLLHHRGHTHTVLLAPVLGAMAVGLAWLWARQRGGIPRTLLPLFVGLATAMALLHTAMDFGNSYGVHPLWPLESRWHYGDSIFILEPLLWAVLAVPLAFAAQTRAARITLGAIAALGLVLSATVPFVTWLGLALVVLVTALVALASRGLGPLGRPALAVFGAVAIELIFFAVHVEAEIHVRGALAAAFPRAIVLDVAMTPSPANPLCWSALGIEIEGDDLVTRRLAVSLAGELEDVSGCRFSPPAETSAERTPIERSSTESIAFFDETRTPLSLLPELAATSEDTAAFLRFSRAPYLLAREGEPTVAGDVRYDREAGLGFGELEVHAGLPLDGWVPGWEPPRIDAIDPARTPAPRVHDIVSE